MSVPAGLGTSFMNISATNSATQEKHVEFLIGTRTPIWKVCAQKRHPVASISADCACPKGATASKQPRTIAHIRVSIISTGQGYVWGRPPLY